MSRRASGIKLENAKLFVLKCGPKFLNEFPRGTLFVAMKVQ
jgi:hypothetical protein